MEADPKVPSHRVSGRGRDPRRVTSVSADDRTDRQSELRREQAFERAAQSRDPLRQELLELAEAAFVTGATWAARELGQPEAESTAWVKRAAVEARKTYQA